MVISFSSVTTIYSGPRLRRNLRTFVIVVSDFTGSSGFGPGSGSGSFSTTGWTELEVEVTRLVRSVADIQSLKNGKNIDVPTF